MKIENLEDLFNHTLEDIYYAENKLVKALPKMAKACDSSALAKAFMGHCEETKEHITRLDEVFKAMGRKSKATECPAIKGILEEGEELMSEIKDPDTRDAAMIAAAMFTLYSTTPVEVLTRLLSATVIGDWSPAARSSDWPPSWPVS